MSLDSPRLPFRSVHNTRIERLWYDVTSGFGQKWKNFFIKLEAECGLNPQNPHHIWLLHHLFLPSINADAQDWAESWNAHRLEIRGQHHRSPIDMFMFSMVQDGPRGIRHLIQEPEDEAVDNPALYGIDWEEAADPTIIAHLLEREPDTWEDGNPFAANAAPPRVSHVPCEAPNCPFPQNIVQILDDNLSTRVNLASSDMDMRRLVWLEACNISSALYEQFAAN
ncbi:hypothetical protein GALMADRAFT_81954 [Galerina marginata CBS 339.88]|uniref:Integrase core domain-containing protein n=1 Tax=Galerina marginata (strain CBS 339.88) TaxID=685588 RepID=A0A067S668_GALM3|nr:hypothetical protein GALMADRAFT_81954 [Galerina marginata CBS 339.88]